MRYQFQWPSTRSQVPPSRTGTILPTPHARTRHEETTIFQSVVPPSCSPRVHAQNSSLNVSLGNGGILASLETGLRGRIPCSQRRRSGKERKKELSGAIVGSKIGVRLIKAYKKDIPSVNSSQSVFRPASSRFTLALIALLSTPLPNNFLLLTVLHFSYLHRILDPRPRKN